jgi:hypothetical protein
VDAAGAWYSNLAWWKPRPEDFSQVDECIREKADSTRSAGLLSDEEICARALREVEVQRVCVEVYRAALAPTLGQLPEDEAPSAKKRGSPILRRGLAQTIAALNLMGIVTLLPGEAPTDLAPDKADGACVYLEEFPAGAATGRQAEQLDALSGLIREFHRSDIMINGLQIVDVESPGGERLCALVAVHRAVLAAFGAFLVRKYVAEGWRLA